MASFVGELVGNRVLLTSMTGWLVAQALKGTFWFVRDRKVDFERFVGPGGMPSSHSASVTSLATAVGLSSGFDSAPFAMAAVFAVVVMYDASGVRRAAGKQAEVLNKIVEDMAHYHTFREERLKELLGHTPVEVFGGAILGIALAIVLM